MIWGIVLLGMALLSLPISFALYWKVFGLWPISWFWFVFFVFVTAAQQKFTQFCAEKLAEWYTQKQ